MHVEDGIEKNILLSMYGVVTEDLSDHLLGDYRTYGVNVSDPDHPMVIHDVSLCKDIVSNMVELFNREHLSPIHIYDVIDDMLP